jgi:tRNA nucleotidyltransferase/poly(A) polymerase
MNLLENLRAFLERRGAQAYLVGGTVRDMLLGRASHDLDVSVPENASSLARAFADQIGGAFFIMEPEFDVARVILDGAGERQTVDFARMRGDSLGADLATRDFTINAMAAPAGTWRGDAGDVIDPFGGRQDAAARRVRAVSGDVFVNDPVRLLRAVRLEAELEFVLDAETEGWVRRYAPLIENAPGERVRDEFLRILGANHALRQLQRLDDLDLLGLVLPELNATRQVTQSPPHVYDVFEHSLHAVEAAEHCEREHYMNVAEGAFGEQLADHFERRTSAERTRRELLRLTLLLHDIGKPATRTVDAGGRIRYFGHEDVGVTLVEPVLRRLKFSGDEVALVKTTIAHHLRPILLAQSGISDRAVYRFFRDADDAGVDIAVHAWCDQAATYGANMPEEVESALQAVIGRLLDRYYHAQATVVAPPPLVNGKDVMELLKLEPGPRVGKLLDAVREAQAVGQVATREQALNLLLTLSTQEL